MKSIKSDAPTLLFTNAKSWRAWLVKNYNKSEGVWLKIARKQSGINTVNYAEALDDALCFGWIDSQRKSFNENYFIQKFSPRRARSIWSKVNIAHTERLIKSRKMRSPGRAEIARAQKDGRWERAYDAPSRSQIPEDFLKALSRNKKAQTFFATLNKSNIYSITWRLQTAQKPETRLKRIKMIIARLALGQKYHP